MFAWFENRINPFPDTAPTQPPGKLLAFAIHYTRGVWPWLIVTSVLIAIISALQVALFGFMGSIVDWLAAADRATFWQNEGWKLAAMGAVVLVVLPILGALHTLFMHQTIVGNYPMRIRWQAHRYLLGQSYAFYQDEFAGRVATKMMQTALGIRESVMKIVDVFVYVIVYFAGAMVLAASFDLLLMLPFAIWLVCYIGLLRHYLPRLRDVSEAQSDARSTMTGRVVDSYTNILTVKLFAHAGREESYARDSMRDFLGTVHPQMRMVSQLNIWLDLVNSALLFAVAAIGIWLWQVEASTVGAVAVGVGLVLRLEGMAHWVMWELAGVFENLGMAVDGMGMLSKPRTVTDKPAATELAVSRGGIRFEHIRFHYGKEGGVIDNLTLDIAPGEKVGIVGRSGAGKSTLMNLLLRLYDLEGGRILIDGQDIAAIGQDSLRRQIGVVTQDTALLHRSVRDNIAYGRPQATEAEIIEAAKRANAHEFILGLSDLAGRTGYDAHVGERGVKLSGGQRQRIAIARVFLKNAPILVLDEATSALDSEVEAAIQDNLNALMEGKTVIAIAHRLSTIASLERLVVMDHGHIVEQGSHDELVRAGGIYAHLWARQSGGFLGLEEREAAE